MIIGRGPLRFSTCTPLGLNSGPFCGPRVLRKGYTSEPSSPLNNRHVFNTIPCGYSENSLGVHPQ